MEKQLRLTANHCGMTTTFDFVNRYGITNMFDFVNRYGISASQMAINIP